jgi:hypothetical protein
VMKLPEEVFLVTQFDSDPDFYHPAKSTRVMSRKAMTMKIAANKTPRYSFIVLRARITDWEDVTEEFTGV